MTKVERGTKMKLCKLERNERGLFTRIADYDAMLWEFREYYGHLDDEEADARARADIEEMYGTDNKSLEDIIRRTHTWGSPARRGKLCFPTKECAPFLCEGFAEIEVVVDKDNFAFFTGRMLQYAMPSDAALCDYIIKNHLEDATFIRKTGSLRGDYIQVIGNREPYLLVGDQTIEIHGVTDVADKATVGESVLGRDIICRFRHGCDFDTFAENFRNSLHTYRFADQYHRLRIQYELDARLTNWVNAQVVDVMVHTHRKTVVHTVDVYTTDEDVLMAATISSPDELQEFIRMVNQLNDDANAATQKFRDRKHGS
jgi:hypothetical protein